MTDNEHDLLAAEFETKRDHLRAVAYRMLGSRSEAEDAVQEAWLRLSRTDTSEVANLGGWLTTVVARVCLDMLRSRESRREEPIEAHEPRHFTSSDDRSHPEHEALLADSVGVALLVVLSTLAPAERVAFVLHDMFDLPFEEIAPIVGRSPTAARQLASRARRRVRGGNAEVATPAGDIDRSRRREIVEAFLAASRGGDFQALLELLDPDVVVRADDAAVLTGASKETRGAKAVAETFSGRARAAQVATIDGEAGLVWAAGGRPRVAFAFVIEGDRIVEIELIADAERLAARDFVVLDK